MPSKNREWLAAAGLPGYDLAAGAPADRVLTFDGIDGRSWAVRRGDWKLLRNVDNITDQLYSLATDQGEKTNLAAQRPDLVAELAAVRATITQGWQP